LTIGQCAQKRRVGYVSCVGFGSHKPAPRDK
jgi:hypothetical protein